ncbi:peptidase M16 [Tyzzerella sp. An114]|uniref:M16 family metallopeptidase n=1 Tax=Tyzzerella sp. An114 TaxID=1965545 RepID=UPI000B4514E9|nr:pitrilysin family protein [Tyzzerella sp. An114]OUQ55867.1 peptidase M16 [Tyzzerella sp. An114]HIT72877.1 insulinase family protein [Candidatus Fimicola cottocaccae]
MVNIKTLKNGIRVAVEEIPYVRSVSFGIWVKNGSRDENINNNGISHFIEHMLFKGTFKRSAKDIAEEMDALGGQINAYTTKEYTCYHTRVLDKHIEKAVDILSDMFLNSKFDDNDVSRERNVILEEINMYDDAPEEVVHDKLQENIWKNSSLGLPILGTADTISNFDGKIIKDYFDKHYTNENTVISIAGNVNENEAFALVEKYFGDKKSLKTLNEEKEKTVYYPSFIKSPKDIEQIHMCMCFPGLERDHENKYDMTIFNTIFGGGMSSRLFQKIREDNGLTYSIYSYISAYTDAGLFAVYAGMNPNQIEKVCRLIYNEIEDIKNSLISDKVIKITKEQIISNYIIGTESTVNRMTSMGGSVLLRNTVQTQEEIISNIESVTAQSVHNIVNKIFDFDKISISLSGNTESIDFGKIMP